MWLGMKKILLSQGKVTVVDDEDFEVLSKYKWSVGRGGNTYYAYTHNILESGKRTTIAMHRMIMKTPMGCETDHRDRDGLNNQRFNLRVCTHSQNQGNRKLTEGSSSGHKGVVWHKRDKKWQSKIVFNGKNIHLGYFNSKDEAALAYSRRAVELFKEYAELPRIIV
jgi:hypothetical protein